MRYIPCILAVVLWATVALADSDTPTPSFTPTATPTPTVTPTPTSTPTPTRTPTETPTPTDTPTRTNTPTRTPTPTPTTQLTPSRVDSNRANMGVIAQNLTAAGASGSLPMQRGHHTIKVLIAGSGSASVTVQCDVIGDGDFTTLLLPTGAASSALTASQAIVSDEWCEQVRIVVASPTPPIYVSAYLRSTGQ